MGLLTVCYCRLNSGIDSFASIANSEKQKYRQKEAFEKEKTKAKIYSV
jgi:hypothetical protein